MLLDLIGREAAFGLTLTLLGAAPASYLPDRLDGVARVALAPALGLCVGVCATNTLLQWLPVGDTYWVVVTLAALSALVAGWRLRSRRDGWGDPGGRGSGATLARGLAQMALVALIVAGPATLTLNQRSSVGPVTLRVYDAVGYVAVTDSEQTRSTEAAAARFPPYRDLVQGYWSDYARGFQNIDATPLEASVDKVLGLQSTDTQSAFLLVIMLAGAFGAFAAVRYVTRAGGWAPVLAAALYGGPLFLALWADSSQAALGGLALLLPFAVLGAEAVRERRGADLVLLGLIASGLLSVYPLFVPAVAVGCAAVLAWVAIRARGRRSLVSRLSGGLVRTAGVVLVAAGLSPVAFARDLRYWSAILTGRQSFATLPRYHLPIDVLPGWLLQTRWFYHLVSIGHGPLRGLLSAALIPLVMLALIVLGLRRYRLAVGLLGVVATCALLALYTAASSGCEYCVQRNLLPVAPLGAVAVALGIAALLKSPTRAGRLAALLALVVVAGSVGERLAYGRADIAETAYFLDAPVRDVARHLSPRSGSVQVEGFGATARGAGEQELVYELVQERTAGRGSISTADPDYSSLAYFGGGAPEGPAFDPAYRLVLTHFAAVATARRGLVRVGPVALQARAQPLDATVIAGVGEPLERLDPAGRTWVQGSLLHHPLVVYVTGGDAATRAWVSLTLRARVPVSIARRPGVAAIRHGDRLSICAAAQGPAPLRRTAVRLSFRSPLSRQPQEVYPVDQVAVGVQLLAVSAQERPC